MTDAQKAAWEAYHNTEAAWATGCAKADAAEAGRQVTITVTMEEARYIATLLCDALDDITRDFLEETHDPAPDAYTMHLIDNRAHRAYNLAQKVSNVITAAGYRP